MLDVPDDLVRDFLGRTGMPPDVAEWRYFDRAFNRSRNRGYVWLRAGRVEGMLGLIPFRVSAGAAWHDANWTCDWTLGDPTSNPGMGVLLLKRAIHGSGPLVAFGGNEQTRRLLPRIAVRTTDDAGLAFHLPLRSGALLRKVPARLRLPVARPLHMIPLRWVRAPGRLRHVATEPGLARSLAPLIEAAPADGWHPQYDFEYVDWQIGRSPVLSCWTSRAPVGEEPRAAAVYWRARDRGDFWRAAVWWRADGVELLEAVLREAASEVYARGGVALSLIASRLDIELLGRLRRVGFVQAGLGRPLYLCSAAGATEPFGELRRLSYLDTDLGFRF